ncbi:hypothetical protein D3C72_1520580 [compost metagenome]
MLDKILAQQLRQLAGRVDPFLCGLRVDVPGAGAVGTVENDHLQADSRIAAFREFVDAHVRHHRQVHVQRLALIVRRQGVDPRDALNGVHRGLEILERFGTIHRVPLLQHTVVFQVGIAQTEGVLIVPVELAGPLHDRAELRTVDVMGNRLDLPVRLFDVDGLLVQRQGLAIQQVTGRILGIQLQAIQGEMLGRVHGVGPGQVAIETDVDHRQTG